MMSCFEISKPQHYCLILL
jgi:hypothetical protein